MINRVLVFYLLLALLKTSTADFNIGDYVYWRKADILAWHLYFPSRALEQERVTNRLAVGATQDVRTGLEASLGGVVRYQDQELQTAQLMMDGTSAQGCVQGISDYMANAIQDEIATYDDCTADVLPKLQRLYTNWTKTNNTYQSAYIRGLTGIDNCAKTYPNKDSLSRLRICVDSWTNNYFTAANSTRGLLFNSPSMSVFIQTVASCAEQAAQGVVVKGWKFLSMLVQCAKLSENVDAESYEEQITSEFYNYLTQNDLTAQIYLAQNVNHFQVYQVEQDMLHYYDIQKRALEKYVIESRGKDYYSGQIRGYLQKYYDTVSSTSYDNPASWQCVSAAYSLLDNIIDIEAERALTCDKSIVNSTKNLIFEVNQDFLEINYVLPYIGNAAILSCFSEGYIFAEKTIWSCFTLTSTSFSVNATDVRSDIVKSVETLIGYENSFFNNASLPCGDSILRRAYLAAERSLYNLQRCLYIDSGNRYAVTTVPVYTDYWITTTPTTTPYTFVV